MSHAFCHLIQEGEELKCAHEDHTESSEEEEECKIICLRFIYSKRHLSAATNVAELIKKNEDLKDDLLKVQEKTCRIGILETLTKDQQDPL